LQRFYSQDFCLLVSAFADAFTKAVE
jgi:hypothetical protein